MSTKSNLKSEQDEDKRDFLNMDDFPKILNNLLLDNVSGIINVVSGKSHSIKYIAEIISRYFKKQINVFFEQTSKNIHHTIF